MQQDDLKMGCMPGDHQVYTKEGYKDISSVTTQTEVAVWNPNTGVISYECPANVIQRKHRGRLVIFSSSERMLTLAVTPMHPMPVLSVENHTKLVDVVFAHLVRYGASNNFPVVNVSQDGDPVSVGSLSGGNITKNTEQYDGMVYGLDVSTGWYLVRHQGSLTVTGNSFYPS